jgi:hypothetical protein
MYSGTPFPKVADVGAGSALYERFESRVAGCCESFGLLVTAVSWSCELA